MSREDIEHNWHNGMASTTVCAEPLFQQPGTMDEWPVWMAEKMTNAVDMEAIAHERLAELFAGGQWMVTPHDDTDDGRAANTSVWLNGIRVWPSGFADSLVVESLETARAERTDVQGKVIWRSNPGHLAEVLGELLELVPPGDEGNATSVQDRPDQD